MASRRFMVTACLVLGRFSVMAGCMFMMLRRFFVVFCALFTHQRELRIFGFGVSCEIIELQDYGRGSQ
jgi:hypothetical protein